MFENSGEHLSVVGAAASLPLTLVEEHDHSPMRITTRACQWGASDRAALWDGCRVGVPCDPPERPAGGWPGGKDGSVHKGPLKDRKLGTRLALVLLPFHGTAGGGCCLVLTEWRVYFWWTGEEVYYHHVTLPSFIEGNLVRFIHCLMSLTAMSCSYSQE